MGNEFWCDTDIVICNINGERYALNGWNGEKYLHCWKCIDRWTAADDREYEVTPIYHWEKWNEEAEEFQDADGNAINGIIGYELL